MVHLISFSIKVVGGHYRFRVDTAAIHKLPVVLLSSFDCVSFKFPSSEVHFIEIKIWHIVIISLDRIDFVLVARVILIMLEPSICI